MDVLEELLPAQNKSYELGLKFKLPQSEVESIHSTYSKPRNCLLQILIEFTNQAEPRPTWRVIVEALRSRAVNLPALARKVEAAHFPDPTSTRDVAPGMSTPSLSSLARLLACLYHFRLTVCSQQSCNLCRGEAEVILSTEPYYW